MRVPRLNYDEWMVLLGDASHSVLPAAGEGINCGLEDATILCKAIEEDEAKAFSHYNDLRHHDVYALGTYAKFLLEGQAAPAVSGCDPVSCVLHVIFNTTCAGREGGSRYHTGCVATWQ